MSQRTRYALVGTGGRSVMYLEALAGQYKEHAELVALCDLSQTRMDWYNRRLAEKFDYPATPTYLARDFDQMVREAKPDVVIVCTVDATHHEYIVRAMDLGCDVISEKPMTTDAEQTQAVLDAVQRTGRSLRVTFNLRYAPFATKVRQLVAGGAIGRPTSADLSWMLDTRHGADYFRRWHRDKASSGGLLVHKSTHHFDLVNWWLNARPSTVFAMGDLKFYGQENAAARGESYDYDRYTGHADPKADPFAIQLDKDEKQRGLYLEAEQESGYIRDRNVFGKGITAEDTAAVMVRYDNGCVLNYSLIAYNPWEGMQIAINGTRGRLELSIRRPPHIPGVEPAAEDPMPVLRICPMFAEPYEVEIPSATGGHGGGDPLLLDQIFLPNPPQDADGRAASVFDGAASALIGICANESIRTGLPVSVGQRVALPSQTAEATHASAALTAKG